jgi:hypothetical protein
MTDEKPSEILTHREVLALLSEQARNGSVTAAVALERATRLDPEPSFVDDELERILNSKK